MMKKTDFMRGVAAGMAVGAFVGMIAVPRRETTTVAARFLKAASTLVENISDAIGM